MRRTLLIAAVLAAFGLGAPAAQAVTTPVLTPPVVTGSWPTAVGANRPTLRAEIDPGGLATTYLFEYTTEADFRAKGFVGATKIPPDRGRDRHRHACSSTSAASKPTPPTASAPSPPTTTASIAVGDPLAAHRRSPTALHAARQPRLGDGLPGRQERRRDPELRRQPRRRRDPGRRPGRHDHLHLGLLLRRTPRARPGPSQYVSTRGESAWGTENVTLPMLSGSYPEAPDSGVPYQLFSDDLGGALVSNGRRCRTSAVTQCPVENAPLPGSGAPAGFRNYYLRSADGTFKALLTSADLASLALDAEHFELAFAGATPDLAHVVLSSCAALTADATEVAGAEGECDPAKQNLYEKSGSALTLINLLPAAPARQAPSPPRAGRSPPTAPASTGPTANEPLPARRRPDQTGRRQRRGEGGPSRPPAPTARVAFFTKGGPPLPLPVAGGTATDLTPGGGVLGRARRLRRRHLRLLPRPPPASSSGTRGAVTPVAAQVDARQLPADHRHRPRQRRRPPPALRLLRLELTAYDNRNINTGVPVPEVYLFTAPGTAGAGTVCVSCNPSGERPIGAASLPGASPNGSGATPPAPTSPASSRPTPSASSSTASTRSPSQDTNGDRDVYQWEAQRRRQLRQAGRLRQPDLQRPRRRRRLLPRRLALTAPTPSSSPTARWSPPTPAPSTSTTPASAAATRCRPTPIPCFGDACQPLPPEPEDPTPGTLRSKASGNLPPADAQQAAAMQEEPGQEARQAA